NGLRCTCRGATVWKISTLTAARAPRRAPMGTSSCKRGRNICDINSSTRKPRCCSGSLGWRERRGGNIFAPGGGGGATGKELRRALPGYDQCIKASHAFNLLDARGVISVTERQSYILRVRELAKACGEAWVHTEAGRAV